MMRFRVVDLSLDGARALLVDADARLHVLQWHDLPLARGLLLKGRHAKLGAHVLVTEDTGLPLRVRFESVDCSQAQALALLHPAAGRAVPAGRAFAA